MVMTGDRRRAVHVIPWAIPLLSAVVSLAIGTVAPLVSPLLIALIIGAVVANLPAAGARGARDSRGSWSADAGGPAKTLLRLGVVLLGFGLPIGDILGIGLPGIVIVLVTVAVTYFSTLFLGDRLGLDRGFVTLLASGFAICGAAAVAAVEQSVGARRRDVGLAVALVTLFGTAMIGVVPLLAPVLGLEGDRAALWAGASIHEVAQVAVAASLLGAGAGTSIVAVAMTTKLARVVLLAPVCVLAARRAEGGQVSRVPAVPWFVVGFVLAVAVRSTGLLGAPVLEAAAVLASGLLAAGMFGLGLGIRMRELWPFPPRVLLLATASTLCAAGTSAALILLLV